MKRNDVKLTKALEQGMTDLGAVRVTIVNGKRKAIVLNKKDMDKKKNKIVPQETSEIQKHEEESVLVFEEKEIVKNELDIPTFLTDDYKDYKRYMENLGLNPSVEDYLKRINAVSNKTEK